MTSRRATPDDLPRLLPLIYATEGMPQWTLAAWLDIFGTPTRAVWLAEITPIDPILGFCVGSLIAGVAELESIAVSPASRQKGIGRMLIAALTTWAESQSAAEIQLEVRASNRQAIALYASCGFKEQGRRSVYYRDPKEDAVLMARQL